MRFLPVTMKARCHATSQRRDNMPYCSSCGRPIPEGQGKSCSMCYGDIAYGRDGYYRQWAEQEDEREREEEEERREQEGKDE